MKAFTDFVKTGYLSGARIIGYRGNKEINISFESLAAEVANYIERTRNAPALVYRYSPETSVRLEPNKTVGLYLSSSVLTNKIILPNNKFITFSASTEMCFDIATMTSTLSTSRTRLCPGGWINIKDPGVSGITTIYYQMTGSSIWNIFGREEDKGDELPEGLYPKEFDKLLEMAENGNVQALEFLREWFMDNIEGWIDIIDNMILTEGSGLDNYPDEEPCKSFIEEAMQCRDKAVQAREEMEKAKNLDQLADASMTASLATLDAFTNLLVNNNGNGTNPCGGVQIPVPPGTDVSDKLDELRDILDELEKDSENPPTSPPTRPTRLGKPGSF